MNSVLPPLFLTPLLRVVLALSHARVLFYTLSRFHRWRQRKRRYTLQHSATHCNSLQLTAHTHTVVFADDEHAGDATHCDTLQRAATHCNSLQLTAHKYSLVLVDDEDASGSAEKEECLDLFMCVAVCYSVLQRVAACCRVLQCIQHRTQAIVRRERSVLTYSCVLQRNAVCCGVLQCTQSQDARDSAQRVEYLDIFICVAAWCSVLQCTHRKLLWMMKLCEPIRSTSNHNATHCNTLQHTATHCDTLRHTATHCNTLQQHIRSTSNQSCEPCELAQYPQQKRGGARDYIFIIQGGVDT